MKQLMTVEGMSCGHCKARVEKALSALAGVKAVTVDLASKQVAVEVDEALSQQVLIDTIDEAGYDVVAFLD